MLTAEQLCRRIIRLIHAPIRICDSSGNITARVFVEKGKQKDPLAYDETLNVNELYLQCFGGKIWSGGCMAGSCTPCQKHRHRFDHARTTIPCNFNII